MKKTTAIGFDWIDFPIPFRLSQKAERHFDRIEERRASRRTRGKVESRLSIELRNEREGE